MTDTGLNIEVESDLIALLSSQGIRVSDPPHITVLVGGVSNRTVLVRTIGGREIVVKQALPRLRVPSTWLSEPRRIFIEAKAIRAFSDHVSAGRIPRLVFVDHEMFALAMEAVPGPHQSWKQLLLGGNVEAHIFETAADVLAQIGVAGSTDTRLSEQFSDRAFFESLRIEPYYEYTQKAEPVAAEFLTDLISDVRSRRLTLVHGDFSPKNILIYDGEFYLIDHEVAHWGDPAFDVGFFLAHIVAKAVHLPRCRKDLMSGGGRFWTRYVSRLGPIDLARDIEARAVRHLLGCSLARVAGRSQLEYLSADRRGTHRQVVLKAMLDPPKEMSVAIQSLAGYSS